MDAWPRSRRESRDPRRHRACPFPSRIVTSPRVCYRVTRKAHIAFRDVGLYFFIARRILWPACSFVALTLAGKHCARALPLPDTPTQRPLGLTAWRALSFLSRGTMAKKHRPDCSQCGSDSVRNDRHDAYYCPKCLIWLEKACGDAGCFMCKDRPEKPPTP